MTYDESFSQLGMQSWSLKALQKIALRVARAIFGRSDDILGVDFGALGGQMGGQNRVRFNSEIGFDLISLCCKTSL